MPRSKRPWLAPRNGGYSANPTDKPRPEPPKGRGSASVPREVRLIPLGDGVYRISGGVRRSALTGHFLVSRPEGDDYASDG
jgi:hypothetical protein